MSIGAELFVADEGKTPTSKKKLILYMKLNLIYFEPIIVTILFKCEKDY